ncbi:hypothetical protein BH11PSE3_BH11PSE3_30280 [soil metagenome]
MTDRTIDLDKRRGMGAQHATDLRRLVSEVQADHNALRQRQEVLENQLLSQPADHWSAAAEKARYLLGLYGATAARGDARIETLIAAVLADFDRLEKAEQVADGGVSPS